MAAGGAAQSGARPAVDGARGNALALNKNAMTDAARDAAEGEQDQADLCSCEVEARRTSPCRSRGRRVSVLGPEKRHRLLLSGQGRRSRRCGARWDSSTPACRRSGDRGARPKRRSGADQHRPCRFPPVAFAHALHRARLRRSRRQGLQQHQRRPPDRMEGQAAAVRRRCRMGRRVQGGQEGELLLERDVESAKEAARRVRSRSTRSAIMAASMRRRGGRRPPPARASRSPFSMRSCRSSRSQRQRRSFRPAAATTRRFRAPTCSPRSASGSPIPRTMPRLSRRPARRLQRCRSSATSRSKSFAKPQPLRTDLERMLRSKGFVDVEIEA